MISVERLTIITSIIFGVLLTSCFIVLHFTDGNFIDSFFPEVFGFALEGLIVISVLAFIQLRLDKKREDETKRRLLGALQAIASNYVMQCRLIALENGAKIGRARDFRYTINSIEKLQKSMIDSNIKSNGVAMDEMIIYVRSHKTLMMAALPIAAQIDSLAVANWSGFLSQISNFDREEGNKVSSIINSLTFLGYLDIDGLHRK